jgi:dihydropteridine reductase
MDFRKNPSSTHNITLSHESTWKANLTLAEESLNELLGERFTESTKVASTKKTPSTLSVVVHCAGSWLGGDIASSSSHASAKDSDSFLSSLDPMLDLNLRSAVSAAHLAGRFLSQAGEGMLVVTGAAAVTKGKGGVMAPTPSMLAYGMSKAATHQLAMSLAEKEGGLKNATVVCVLPTMIDTPSNRSFAPPTTDFGSWTPPAHFAEIMVEFAQKLRGTEAEAENQEKKHVHQKVELKHGGFYRFETKGGKTHVTLLPH